MTILITNLAIMGYGPCAFYKPLDLFFLKKSVSCISKNISSAWSGWRSTYTSFKWSRLFRVMRCKLQNPGTFLGCFQLLGTTNDLQCRRECYLLLASKVERVWHLLDTKFAAAKTSEEEQARSTYTVYTILYVVVGT